MPMTGSNRIAASQGLYYVATGIWPLVSRRSFEAVTGRKSDFWLVQTLGGLIAATGVALLASARSARPSVEAQVLAVGSAAALAAADVIFWARREIPKVYLLDAAIEAAIIAAWSGSERGSSSRGSEPDPTKMKAAPNEP